MTADQWAIAGIIVSLVIGVPAYLVAKSVRKTRQDQIVGPHSRGYQAGGDIKIGVDE